MRHSILHLLRRECAVPLLTGLVLIGSAIGQGTPLRLDSSDWWSYTRQEGLPYQEPRHPIHFQNREPAESNFQIAGVPFDAPRHDFSVIRSKFGEGNEVERGDAASGRNQICYVSTSGSVHLIFEFRRSQLSSVPLRKWCHVEWTRALHTFQIGVSEQFDC
jgi:hypothetical protein